MDVVCIVFAMFLFVEIVLVVAVLVVVIVIVVVAASICYRHCCCHQADVCGGALDLPRIRRDTLPLSLLSPSASSS